VSRVQLWVFILFSFLLSNEILVVGIYADSLL
jgi:hypothetical protein